MDVAIQVENPLTSARPVALRIVAEPEPVSLGFDGQRIRHCVEHAQILGAIVVPDNESNMSATNSGPIVADRPFPREAEVTDDPELVLGGDQRVDLCNQFPIVSFGRFA